MTWHVAELHYNTATGEAEFQNRYPIGPYSPVPQTILRTLLCIVYENFPDPRIEELEIALTETESTVEDQARRIGELETEVNASERRVLEGR